MYPKTNIIIARLFFLSFARAQIFYCINNLQYSIAHTKKNESKVLVYLLNRFLGKKFFWKLSYKDLEPIR